MLPYTAFDFLCNEPYFIQGIGYVKCPTLRDIRKITYNIFIYYINIINISFEDYLKAFDLQEKYNNLNDEQKKLNTLYNMLLYDKTNLLFSMLPLFVVDEIEFNDNTLSFDIYKTDNGEKKQIGHIGNDNFEEFRENMKYILGLKRCEEKEEKFKNNLAKRMYEKLKRHAQTKKKEQDEDYSLDNMIKKYCTHNKVGINILNVWDLSYYQFIQMFNEYCNGRQCDINDMMAANTFSYKKPTDYNSLGYMKKIDNDK